MTTSVIIKRVHEDNRLTWFRSDAHSDYWKQHWRNYFEAFQKSKRLYEKGELGRYETIFTQWLPREGRIVEAGCGLSPYVLALRARGYDVEGIDYDANCIKMIKELYPDLPICQMDARSTTLPNNHFSGYISLGVIEHLREGPEAFITEAFRILKPGGRAIFTVPWFNPYRQLRAKLGMYDKSTEDLPFYQYALSREELERLFTLNGFIIRHVESSSTLKGIKDEVTLVNKMLRWGITRPMTKKTLRKIITTFPRIRDVFGHIIMFVLEKPSSE